MVRFNDNWEFAKMPLHTTLEEINQCREVFAPVGIPHDWLIYDTDHLYQDATGWYRKTFSWICQEDQMVFLRFGGIYMDSRIYVNNMFAFAWKYGYSTFEVDITPFLKDGKNEIKVSVDFQSPNSRWYSGAGIYRDVWIKTVHKKHLISDGIYVHSEKRSDQQGWDIEIDTEAVGEDLELRYEWKRSDAKKWSLLEGERTTEQISATRTCYRLKTTKSEVECWDIDSPVCYQLRVTLQSEGRILQQEVQTIGFRTIEFIPERGFVLNGKKVKLKGVCEHHDLGCLGSAYHTQAMERKFRILKEMGVNAVRLTHNMHDEDVLNLADRMGILLISEAFDMWESPKNPYDYARFFADWYEKDVASWIRRDRNHPSVILWSIGNEIYDTHVGESGQKWTKTLCREVQKHDPKGNARPTIGSNYMPWEPAQACADLLKIAGYNYGEAYYDSHHEKHPDWVIYGSETASTVQSRGIYHFPFEQSVLADEDEQCSALGNSTTSWGAKSLEACILAERDHDYSCGQFLWTGFDYIGEPTPYHTRNSYFGQVDTCGFPKDSYYIYQAEWTDYRTKPMIHLFPYWDFNEGQQIDVRVCSNAPVVELYVNGQSQGVFRIDHAHGRELVAHWKIPYQSGEIRAIALDEDNKIVAEEIRHSFGEAARICMKPEKRAMQGDGEDLLFVEISMTDTDGYPVENANNRIHIRLEGPGDLVGLDNGDSTDTDPYKGYSKRMFSGKLLAVIKAKKESGTLTIHVSSPGIPKAVLTVPVIFAPGGEGSSALAYLAGPDMGTENKERPVRNIYLHSENGTRLSKECPETRVYASIHPADADDSEVFWGVIDEKGIPSHLATLEPDGTSVLVRAKSDGIFRLRCMSRSHTKKARILSHLEFEITGLGKAFRDPYEFVSAGLFDYSSKNVGNGNEHGVATARGEESRFGFYDLDFGPYGSDEIQLPIFALTSEPYRIRIYEGMPTDADAGLLADVIYQKPSLWNVYQEATYRLNRRLCGVTGICFVLEDKIHLKGFQFIKKKRGYQRNYVVEYNQIYGDSFQKKEDRISHIGNNVTLEFANIEFGEDKADTITICGETPLEKNSILICFVSADGETRQMVEFLHGESEQTFRIPPQTGTMTVRFVFLPGSQFDFMWFQFQS